MNRICKICGISSNAGEFFSGVTNRCKECHKERVRQNRAEKSDYYRAYDSMRFQKDPRVKARHRRYRKTEAGKISTQKSREKWLAQNPEKRAAHIILNNRIRDGIIQKPDKCQECGATGRIEGHHEDCAMPLKVDWLCRYCHARRHK